MITLLSILPLLLIATTAEVETPRLLQVQIIIRHADRAPMEEFTSPEAAALFPRGLGELTDEGIRHATQQGQAFREHYTELGLLSANTRSSEIYIRSSPIKRVLMSASAFATSFIGSIVGQTRLPVIHTTNSEEDEKVLIVQDSVDHRCEVLLRHNISDRPLCRSAAIAELENSAAHLDNELEKCARGDGRKIQFRSLSVRPGIGAEFNATRAQQVIGPLVSIIGKNVDDSVKGDMIEGMRRGAPVRIYYTHDHNILAVAQALGIISEFGQRNPEFSSAIAIETWSSSEGFDIKIVMKDGVNNPFKSVAKFRFLDFKKRISSYLEVGLDQVQWDDQLRKIYTVKQFALDAGQVETTAPKIPRLRPAIDKNGGRTFTFEILLIAAMLCTVVAVLVRRRNTYTRMY